MSQPEEPTPIGAAAAAREVITVAAPLLTAASLALSGVVASVDEKYFKWPGLTLTALVLASLLLIASIELQFHARQFLYSRADMDDWLDEEILSNALLYSLRRRWRVQDFKHGSAYKAWSAHCFNLGVLSLGVGVAIALAPARGAREHEWRWVTVALVSGGVMLEIAWMLYLYATRSRLWRTRNKEFNLQVAWCEKVFMESEVLVSAPTFTLPGTDPGVGRFVTCPTGGCPASFRKWPHTPSPKKWYAALDLSEESARNYLKRHRKAKHRDECPYGVLPDGVHLYCAAQGDYQQEAYRKACESQLQLIRDKNYRL